MLRPWGGVSSVNLFGKLRHARDTRRIVEPADLVKQLIVKQVILSLPGTLGWLITAPPHHPPRCLIETRRRDEEIVY